VKEYTIEVAAVAEAFGVTEETVRRWARTKAVPARRTMSRRWLFNADDLAKIAVRRVVEPDE
jgi:DNA-binding transcriptional MerR regulator